ncbi:hypothetical protein BDW02DRAFT_183868 [Decorospora gaudefroyi]|uniref:Uncharacterized protein n=1 Tax=Decorospora gaudefroyi TaxID=184978 RepID=A0A6A5K3M5_9PLEO|nr:hypothetical protein BDW02DRAFT_183868 [Decorospora gaudefroyi]
MSFTCQERHVRRIRRLFVGRSDNLQSRTSSQGHIAGNGACKSWKPLYRGCTILGLSGRSTTLCKFSGLLHKADTARRRDT